MSSLNIRKLFKTFRSQGLLLLLSGSISVPALAQTPGATVLSIKDAIQFGQQNNSNIRVSQIGEQIGQKQISEVKGRALPQVSGNGSFEDRLKIPLLILPTGLGGTTSGSEGIPLGKQYNTALTGEVTQMLFDPSFNVGLRAAKVSSRLNEQNTRQVIEQTSYNIASAYYQAIVVDKQLLLLRSNLINTQRTLQLTELQLQNGVAKRVDVSRLRVNASNIESQIRQAELNLEQALNQLKNQMGMPLTQPIALSDTTLTLEQDAAALASVPEDVFVNRLEYQILQSNLELQTLDQRNIGATGYPNLRAFGNYGYSGQGDSFGLFKTEGNNWVDYTTASVGVRLSIPVFDGFQRRARVQQSNLKARQLEENINLTKQNINLEISNALTQYRNTLQRIQAEQQNVQLAQEVYGVTQLEMREGVGTTTNVVEAETALRQAQNTYITTLLNLYTARLDLERSKGTLLTYLNSK